MRVLISLIYVLNTFVVLKTSLTRDSYPRPSKCNQGHKQMVGYGCEGETEKPLTTFEPILPFIIFLIKVACLLNFKISNILIGKI